MTLAIDGKATTKNAGVSNNGTSVVTLTTTGATDVIYVVAASGNSAVTGASIAGGGLVWTKRVNKGSAAPAIFVFWAVTAAPLSSTAITVTVTISSGTATIYLNAFGVSGANTTTPFDTNVGLPVYAGPTSSTTPSASVTTSNGDDMILGAFFDSNGAETYTPGTGFSTIQIVTNDNYTEQQVVSSLQTALTVGLGNAYSPSATWVVVGDAIQAAITSGTTTGASAGAGTGGMIASSLSQGAGAGQGVSSFAASSAFSGTGAGTAVASAVPTSAVSVLIYMG